MKSKERFTSISLEPLENALFEIIFENFIAGPF